MTAEGWAVPGAVPGFLADPTDPILAATADVFVLEAERERAELRNERRRTERRRQDAADRHDHWAMLASVGAHTPRSAAETLALASQRQDAEDRVAEIERSRELRDLPTRAEQLQATAESMEKQLAESMGRARRYESELARRR